MGILILLTTTWITFNSQNLSVLMAQGPQISIAVENSHDSPEAIPTKKSADCEETLDAMLRAEFFRLKGLYPLALAKLETARRTHSNCVEIELLHAEILFELVQRDIRYTDQLLEHLLHSIDTYPKHYEFHLMALEVCIFLKPNPELGCDPILLMSQLESRLLTVENPPAWAQSKYHELKAELLKRQNRERESAGQYLIAWDLNRENSLLLAEAAIVFARYGQIRTSLRFFERYLAIKLARTGLTDRSISIRMLHKKLILEGTDAIVDEFAQTALNDHSILDAAERVLKTGRIQTCKSLLDQISRAGKRSPSFKRLAMRQAKWAHYYDGAVDFSLQLLDKTTPKSSSYHRVLEDFLSACILAGRGSQALEWCLTQNPQFKGVEGFSRILLSLLLEDKKNDRTLWNQTFYTSELNPGLEAFRVEAETVGLSVTLKRIKLRRFLYYRDRDGATSIIRDLLSQKDLDFNLKLEIADTLAVLGKTPQAFEIYEELLTLNPKHPLVLNNFGYFLCDASGDLDRAEELIRAALKLDPKNDASLDSLAWLNYWRGNYYEAKRILVPLVGSDTEDPVKLEHLGDIYMALNENNRALDCWSRALKLRPDNFLELLNKLDPEP